ncbi:MAG: G5 domain-containing protein [Clostridiales bacterium]|nr:G5 domain-containing protein [Clostridiales bacterium]
MTKRLRVIAIVIGLLALFSGSSISAYNEESLSVTIIEGNNKSTANLTEAVSVEKLLELQGIEISEDDELNYALDYIVSDGDEIEIKHNIYVTIYYDGVPRMVRTTSLTVGELLKSLSSDYEDHEYYLQDDIKESTELEDGMTIELSSTLVREVTTYETVEKSIEYRDTDDLAEGTERVVQEGSDGLIEIVSEETYVGSQLSQTVEISREVVTEPVNCIIERGTATMVSTPAGDFKYSESLTVVATGYTQYDEGCTSTTATGTAAIRGAIAVDPSVIPLGSKIYVPGYGIGTAEDIEGAIEGYRIDLCYNSVNEAYAWGVQTVTVYILQ